MKTAALAIAAGAVLAADAVLLLGVAYDRRGDPEARLALSERELTLGPRTEDNSALFLRMAWQQVNPPQTPVRDGPELRRPTVRKVFAVLELRSEMEPAQSRLFLVDAGPDRAGLRERYPDRTRYAVVEAAARSLGGSSPDYTVLVESVYVPPDYSSIFQGLEETPSPVKQSRYQVELCFGNRGQPWVCGAGLSQK